MTGQPNAAVVPEPDPQPERTYRVAKTAQSVLGHRPGDTFQAVLDPGQERLLLASGALAIVADEPAGKSARRRRQPADGPSSSSGDAPDTSPAPDATPLPKE